MHLTPETTLPEDGTQGTLVGRVFRPDVEGPSIVVVRKGGVFDITRAFPTMRDLGETYRPHAAVDQIDGELIGPLADILANTPEKTRERKKPWLLAPVDLQAIKAAGVTFAISMLERVIEEQARGDASKAAGIRAEVESVIGGKLDGLKPGSPAAMDLKAMLKAKGLWSQYLEVGIGPDAEIFTKAPPMAAVGTGMSVGVNKVSTWNNPEPEIVLAVNSKGDIWGATLGNDVNLRDVEGRSALLLGKAKDNNASAAIGPFIRVFDFRYTLDDVRKADIAMTVTGTDGFTLEGASSIAKISRDPADLVAQMIGPHHHYPDGAVLYLGTMFAPVKDRDAPGQGFTHHEGDVVTIRERNLGTLVNVVTSADKAPPWNFGTSDLMRNLARRKLI
jgi:fumarylacetoacetate (FAA) hydrolase family protein